MSAIKQALEVQRILEAGMRSLNITGEIVVRTGGSTTVSWVGQPSPQDVIVDVRVSGMSEGAAA